MGNTRRVETAAAPDKATPERIALRGVGERKLIAARILKIPGCAEQAGLISTRDRSRGSLELSMSLHETVKKTVNYQHFTGFQPHGGPLQKKFSLAGSPPRE